ncbi:MAG: DNA replication complex GINS family protein [Methanobacteriota archaeon]|nr:MAG: DNA replication complex GINS family protein [Euryarchaeota archaeon]
MRDVMADKRGDMGYEDIMTLFRMEYRSQQLTKVDPALYQKIGAYVRSLRKENEKEIAKSPNSPASMMLNDQLKKSTDKAKRVYELRQRKIALLALRKVAGDSPETGNLTPDELVLFSSLVSVLTAHRGRNADLDAPDASATDGEIVEAPEAVEESEEAAGRDQGEAKGAAGFALVRVMEDVPTFAGVDRDYTLRKEDVVSLPKNVADALAAHGKIKLIEPS